MPVAPVPLAPCEPRETNQRAMMFTISVSTNSTSPAANSAEVWIPVDLAELVGDHRRQRVALVEQVASDHRRAADHEHDGDRLADAPAPCPSIAPPVIPGREYGSTAIRIISQRVAPSASAASLFSAGTVAITSREIADTIGRIMIARIRPGDEVVVEGRDAAPDPRDERERAREPLLGREQLRREHEHAPQSVDDRRNRGEQVDEDRQRTAQPARAQLVDEHGAGDGDRHADDQRDRST